MRGSVALASLLARPWWLAAGGLVSGLLLQCPWDWMYGEPRAAWVCDSSAAPALAPKLTKDRLQP